MTRIALLGLLGGAMVATGCDRVFGLIGGGTPIDADARQVDSSTPGEAGDAGDAAAPGQPFCSMQGATTQYCLDFEEAQPLAGFSQTKDNGMLDLTEEQARSPSRSMRTRIDFSMVGAGANPRAFATRDINTDTAQFGIPDTYGFSVYIPPTMAADIAIFEIVTSTLDLTMFASGTFSGKVASTSGITDFSHPLVNAIQRDMWVPIQIVLTYMPGAIDVQFGGGPVEEEGVSDFLPMTHATISIGLQQSLAPSDTTQNNIVVYYDDIFVR